MDSIHSHHDQVECMKCHSSFRYTPMGLLEGAPFRTVQELFAWEKREVENAARLDIPYTAAHATLITVSDHVETPIASGPMLMNRNELHCGDFCIPLTEISDMAMHGRHALVFTAGDQYYELKPAGDNTLKFHLLYEAHKKYACQAER